MTTFAFTATVSGLDLDNGAQLDDLYTDAFVVVPSSVDGVTSIDVEIDAASGEEALQAFLAHIADAGVQLVRVLEDLVNVPEIAERLGVKRETVRTWVTGARGAADFPAHRAMLGNQKTWPWSAVFAWAVMNGRLPADEPAPLDSACVDWVNGRLAPQPAPAETVVYILSRPWASGAWTTHDARVVTTAAARQSEPAYASRDGQQWQISERRMGRVQVGVRGV